MKLPLKTILSLLMGGDVHLPPNDINALRDVLSLQEEFGLTAASYGTYYRLGEENYSLWESITDTANAIGAKIIRIWQGTKASADVNESEFLSMVNETKNSQMLRRKKVLPWLLNSTMALTTITAKALLNF